MCTQTISRGYSHSVSFREVRDFRTDLLDDPGGVRTANVGEILHEVAEQLDLPVDRVERGGSDLDEKVFWARSGHGSLADDPLVTVFIQKEESFLSSGGHCVISKVVEESEVSEAVDVEWRMAY